MTVPLLRVKSFLDLKTMVATLRWFSSRRFPFFMGTLMNAGCVTAPQEGRAVRPHQQRQRPLASH